jgi:hypothetical protein
VKRILLRGGFASGVRVELTHEDEAPAALLVARHPEDDESLFVGVEGRVKGVPLDHVRYVRCSAYLMSEGMGDVYEPEETD